MYRLTRIIVQDEVLDEQRDALETWLEEHGHDKLVYLSGCYWCSGFWMAVAAAVLRARAPEVWRAVRWPLAMSAAAGLIAEHAD